MAPCKVVTGSRSDDEIRELFSVVFHTALNIYLLNRKKSFASPDIIAVM